LLETLDHSLAFGIEHEVAMLEFVPQKETVEDQIVWKERTACKRFKKSTNWSCIVVHAEIVVEVEVADHALEVEDEQVPNSVVHIRNCEESALIILFDGTRLDILSLNVEFVNMLLSLNIYLVDFVMHVTIFDQGYKPLRSVINNNINSNSFILARKRFAKS